MQKPELDSSSRIDTIPPCDGQTEGQTDGQTDRQTRDDSVYCASITSRGSKNN